MFAKVRFLSLIIGQRGRLVYEKMCSKKSVLELNRPLPVHFLSVTFVFFSKMADIPLDCADSMKQPQTGHLIKHYLWRLSSDELKLWAEHKLREACLPINSTFLFNRQCERWRRVRINSPIPENSVFPTSP